MSLEKKERKTMEPFFVLISIAWSLIIDIALFSILVMSSLGILMKVPPKKRLLELNFE